MTTPQILAFAIIGAMMALFVWGRLRYDLVAVLALFTAIVAGIVPYDKAFSGFSDDIVIIVASALLVSAAVQRSGIVETLLRPIAPRLTTTTAQVAVLAGSVALLSAFVKNIGALAMLMPAAFQLARKNKTPVSYLLMPMAFAALLGGIVTLVGTSPNIIVARMREELVGTPFSMFDFTPVGACLAIGGVIFLTFGWRLLPGDRKGASSMDEAFNLEGYTTEVTIPEGSPLAGKTVGEIEKLSEGAVEVLTILRSRDRVHEPPSNTKLRANHKLILMGQPDALKRLADGARLKLVRDENTGEIDAPDDDIGVMEAVVTAESPLVDRSAMQYRLHDHHQVNLLAVSRSGRRIAHGIGSTRLKVGDVIVLQGDLTTMPEALGELRCLPLAHRNMQFGRGRRGLLPVAVLAFAMILMGLGVVPVAIAFFGAAVAILLIRALTLREAYEVVEWPLLVMLGALDSGQRCAAHDRRDRSDRGLAVGLLAGIAADRRAGSHDGGGNGGDAIPQQRRHGAGDGADRRRLRQEPRLQSRSVPDGGRDRCGLRFPDADRPPVQHAGDERRRLPLRRLPPAGISAVGLRPRGGRAADCPVLAVRAVMRRYLVPSEIAALVAAITSGGVA